LRSIKYWHVAVLVVVLISIWWISTKVADSKDPLNKTDAYVYDNDSALYWFELKSRNGKVEGKLYQQEIIEEIGGVPFLDERTYPLTGKLTDNGYELTVTIDGEVITYDSWISGKDLYVQTQEENNRLSFKAVNKEELDEYIVALQDNLENAIYHAEKKEQDRLREFFSAFNHAHGYLYSEEDASFQLFLKVDEALLEGEVTGSLLVMEKTGNENDPYQETTYELNGITDGVILELYTTVDGKSTKLEGDFHESAASFELSFWKTEKKLLFQVVTEGEFNQKYEEFKLEAAR
jgi:hypothetical protein